MKPAHTPAPDDDRERSKSESPSPRRLGGPPLSGQPTMEDDNDGALPEFRARESRRQVDRESERVENGNDDGLLPAVARPTPPSGGVPSAAALARVLEETTDVETLRCLHEQAAVWEEAGARLKLAQEEVVRIAEFRIRIERKMGEQLAQTVHRGGHGSNSRSASSKSGGSSAPLPSGINWSASWRYRRLATIREDRFEEYLALARAQLRVPSARGVVVFAAEARTENAPREARKPRSVKATVPLSKNLTDAVQRLLTVDVCVGGRSRLMVAARTVGADLIHVKQLEGAVFVAECPDPRAWLAALAAARTRGRVAEAVVVLPAATAEPWFKLLDEGGWSCCFVRGSTTVVAYHGKRTHGFRLAFSELGAVLHGGGSGGVGSRE